MEGKRLKRRRVASCAGLLGLITVVGGCASSVVPPTVTVLQGRLVGAGLLDQQLQMVLCISNPNDREIALSHVGFQFQLEDDVLAKGKSEAPLLLPPHGSIPVPFAVDTTLRNLGSPLETIVTRGSVDYVVSESVVLRDFSLIGIPYSIRGHVTPAAVAGDLLEMQASAPAPSACSGQVVPSASAALQNRPTAGAQDGFILDRVVAIRRRISRN